MFEKHMQKHINTYDNPSLCLGELVENIAQGRRERPEYVEQIHLHSGDGSCTVIEIVVTCLLVTLLLFCS